MISRGKIRKQIFNFTIRDILKTQPVICDPTSSLVVLSQSYHLDLFMFLIATKSFAHFIQPKSFVVIDDGFTERDKEIISRHLGVTEFIATCNISTESCPTGGTWERLVSIINRCTGDYIIQLDSDTVTCDYPDEVATCIKKNKCFTLSTLQGRAIAPVQETAAFADKVDGNHVQILAERVMKKLPNAGSLRYVRGCSGFAGFGKNSVTIEDLKQFSKSMEQLLGLDVWKQWGSEQVASNFLIANSDQAFMLPFEHYPYWKPGISTAHAKLIHFIGDSRFLGGEYIRQAKRTIRDIS